MSIPDLTLTPASDPLLLYRERDGLYAVDLLSTAIVHLDFFSRLAEHPADRRTLCLRFALADRPTDVMLTLFAALGLVESENGVFQVTAVARDFLVKGSPCYMGPYFAALKDRPVCQDYLTVLRTGRPANWGGARDGHDWHKSMEDESFAQAFTAAMDCRGAYLGPALARTIDCGERRQLLDVAGGSGVYACAMVATQPHLRATVMEKPPVDEVAARAIAQRGFADRVSVVARDMLTEDWPTGFDVHLISNVLHDWDEPVVRQLLQRSYQALDPSGQLIIHDAHINATKTGPLPVARYSALLMHSTEGKCYSTAEIEEMLHAIGFREVRFTPTVLDRSVITASKI